MIGSVGGLDYVIIPYRYGEPGAFPSLSGLVFMEPQMLLDKVSELVEETYHMRQGKKGVPGEKLRFRDHGEVTEKFLGEFESHYEVISTASPFSGPRF